MATMKSLLVALGATRALGAADIAVAVTAGGALEPPSVANGQLPAPDLPMPEMKSGSVIGPSLATSKNAWPPKRKPLRDDAPNILLIINDDSGYGHSDVFGGPVHTPSLGRVRDAGVAFNRFHTTAICSPTRASLLTGRNAHMVGTGQITELAAAFPGYTGKIPKSAATVAKVLSGYGYDTAAFGKWHNTPVNDLMRTGPFDQYPTGLGFSYFYGFLAGETSQYEPRLYENTNPIEPPYTPEEGYHLTEDMAAQAVKFIRNNRALTPDRPFFIYFAPGGTHGPHHVRAEWADKYKGKFDAGWEALRNATYANQKSMGWIPETAKNTPIDPLMIRWDDVPQEERAFQTRLMEVYAGYLEHTDTQHGKILDELDRQNLTDNTLVIYVFADNGASAEGFHGTISELLTENRLPSTAQQQIDLLQKEFGGLDALGSKRLDNMYHSSWAWAGDTPFKSTKLDSSHFGGTRTPMVVSWPRVVKPDRTPRSQFHHVCDVVPTIYEAVGITPPGRVDGHEQDPLNGVSMVYAFNNASAEGRKAAQYFEVMGSRGIYRDGWFAGTRGPRTPWAPNDTVVMEWLPENDVWELYNLEQDFSQADDLATQMPEKLEEMKAVFMLEAAKNQVFPIGAGLYTLYYHPEEAPKSSLTEWTFFPGQNRIAETNAPLFRTGFSSSSVAEVEVPENASGVIFCVGGTGGGFTVFLDGGYLQAEYLATVLYRYKVRSSSPIPAGSATIEVRLVYDSTEHASPATLTLLVNGASVGEGRVEKSCGMAMDFAESFDVGEDLGSAVSLDYDARLPFPFSGTIKSLHIRYLKTNTAGAPTDGEAAEQLYVV